MGCFLIITQRDLAQLSATMKASISVVGSGARGGVTVQVHPSGTRSVRQMAREIRKQAPGARTGSASDAVWTLTSAKQEMWRRAAEDPMQNSEVRGWIKHQLHQQERIRQAREEGRRPPGGSEYRIKAPPSYDAGHKIPGIHTLENLRPELRSMNRARPGIARRMGITNYR